MDVLRTELDFFEKHRKEWFEHHSGKLALIKGNTLHDFYDTYETALKVGYDTWGLVPFLIKEVRLEDPILFNFMNKRLEDDDQDE